MWERFLVQQSERAPVGWLFILSLLSGIPQIATMTAGTTLVASGLDPESIPTLLLASGAVLVVVSTIALVSLRNLSARDRALALAIAMSIGTAAVALVSRTTDSPGTAGAVLYIWSRVENAVLAIILLTAANSLLSPRASRRTLGIATTGQVITLIAGSALVPFLLRLFTVADLAWISLLAHLAIVVHVGRSQLDRVAPQRSRLPYAQHGQNRGWRNLGRELRRYRSNDRTQHNLTISVFALIAMMYVVYYVADATFLSGLGTALPDDAAVATYVARFWLIVGVAALVWKVAVTGRLLSRHGLALGLIATPVLMVATFSGGLALLNVLGPLAIVVAAKSVERVLDSALFLPSYYGLFQGFRPKVQSRNQLIAESLMGQGIASVAGFALLVFGQSEQFSLRTTFVLGAVAATLWVVLAIFTIRRYRAATLAFLIPPAQKKWDESEKNAGVSAPIADTESDDLIDRSVVQALALELEIRATTQNHNEFGTWEPLIDALQAEQRSALLQAATLLDERSGIRRLHEGMLKVQSLEGAEQAKALDGLEPTVEPRWREAIVSVLGSDEGFLVTRAMSRISPRGSRATLSYSPWVTHIKQAATTEQSRRDWEKGNADLMMLKKSKLFSRFALEELRELARGLRHASYKPGDRLMSNGETGNSMLIVTEGVVSVTRRRTRLATVQPGESVGELSALFLERRSANVTASTEASALVMEGTHLWRFLREHRDGLVTFESVLRKRIAERLAAQSAPDEEIEPLDSQIRPARATLDVIQKLDVLNGVSVDHLQSLAANAEFATLDRGARFLCLPNEVVLLTEGLVQEYCGEYPSLRIHPGAQVGSLAWTGYTGRQVWGLALEKSTLLRVREGTYQAFLPDAFGIHVVALYSLVMLSRVLSQRSAASE